VFFCAQIVALTGFQYSIFKYKQSIIRSEIKSAIKKGVPKEQLVDFRFHMQEQSWINLEWTKPEKEFRFNNQMYDVVETHKSNDTIYFKCIHDVKESGLFHQLDQMTENRSDKDKSVVIFWSKQVYSPKNGMINLVSPFEVMEKTSIPIHQKSEFHLFPKAPTPPPPQV
jgi:hypothetical protein